MRQLIPLIAGFALLTGTAVLAQPTNTPAAPGAGSANAPVLAAPPSDSLTVTVWYRQNVYDPKNTKIGQIVDVLLGRDGRVSALVIGAGGFLGIGKHDVVVPFSAVKMVRDEDRTAANAPPATPNAPPATTPTDPVATPATGQRKATDPDTAKNRPPGAANPGSKRAVNSNYRLVMDTSRDALMQAPTVKYDRAMLTWVQDDSNRNTNTGGAPGNKKGGKR